MSSSKKKTKYLPPAVETDAKGLHLAEYCATHRTRERHQDGWVTKTGTKTKKWTGWYHVYVTKRDGTEKRLTRSRVIGPAVIMKKHEAEDEHRVWLRRLEKRPAAETAQATVATLCDDFIRLNQGNWGDKTRKTYQALFDYLVKPVIGKRPIASITAEDLKLLVNELPNRTYTTRGTYERGPDRKLRKVPGKVKTGISDSYAKKAITKIRGIFDLAHERDLITKNPARSITIKLRVPKGVKKADKSVFPPQYLPALLMQLDTRDTLIVWIAMLGATRPGELFAIKGGDVGPNWVHIQRALDENRKFKETKTEKPRFVSLPPEIASELQDWIRLNRIGVGDLVFPNQLGKPLDGKNIVRRRLRPAAKRAQISATDIDFQMLRRSFSTLAQMVGFDVKAIQAQLGHSKPNVTAGEYMQPIDSRREAQLERLERMLRGKEAIPDDVTARIGSLLVQ